MTGLPVMRISAQSGRGATTRPPASIARLTSMKDRARPITIDERRGRIERARRLMAEHKLDAIMLTGGSSLRYFTGVRWGTSERLFAVVLPARADPFCVCPAFENDRAHEQLALGPIAKADVLTWQEDESPFDRVAQGLRDRNVATGRVGVEETTPFVFADSVAAAAPAVRLVGATPVTAGCRMIKDAHEIALMRLASQVTYTAYEAVYRALAPGMSQTDVEALIDAAYARLGFSGDVSVQVGEYTALPHGSITPQTIREGTLIMLDDGCTVEGYWSDITRTFPINGKFTQAQRDIYDLVLKTQKSCVDMVRPGVRLEDLKTHSIELLTEGMVELGLLKGDPKKLIEEKKYMQFYMHNLGHYLGIDVHDAGRYYFNGESRPAEAGMVMTIEPGLYISPDTSRIPEGFNKEIPEKYLGIGVRIEDDVLVTENGSRVLTHRVPKDAEEIEALMAS